MLLGQNLAGWHRLLVGFNVVFLPARGAQEGQYLALFQRLSPSQSSRLPGQIPAPFADGLLQQTA
jgi:hypothetical protein